MVSSINRASYRDLRLSGLASGMDTEEIIAKLISTEQSKVDSLKADKQMAIWEQEAYHEIINKLNEFTDSHFNILDSENNILSMNGSKKVSIYNQNSDFEKYIDIIANGDAVNGKYVINEIKQIAKASSTQSTAKCSGAIKGTVDLNSLTYPLDYSGYNNKVFAISLDGVMRKVNINKTYANSTELINDLNSQFNDFYGDDRVKASISSENTLELTAPNSIIQTINIVKSPTDIFKPGNFLEDVGIKSGDRNLINIDRNAEELFNETQQLSFKINGKTFSFDKSLSIRDMMDQINVSDARVNMTYNTLTDKFSIVSKDTGESSAVEIENISGNLFGDSSYINIGDQKTRNGQDAVVYINDNGKTSPITRSSNVFTIDGVTFSLKEATTQAIEYNVENNTEGVYEKISSFVKSFNELYDSIHTKIYEKKYKDFQPLTEEQKGDMSENEIKLWEEKAKSGILRRDSILMSMESSLRNAFWDKIEGVGTSFKEIGITESEDYEKFELIIDETKLKEAISKDPKGVMKLFQKEDLIDYSPVLSSEESAQRYKETGFAQRVHDIIMSNARTNRNQFGLKGVLLEKAGLKGDVSSLNNIIEDSIQDIDKRIDQAIERMQNKEDRYWKKFSAMEAAMQRLNAQSDWLYAQFSQ